MHDDLPDCSGMLTAFWVYETLPAKH